MKHRRVVAVLSATVFGVSVVAGCGSSGNSTSGSAETGLGKKVTADQLQLNVTKPSQPYNISFVLGATQGTYFDALQAGGEQAAKELGISLDVAGPPTYDAAKQADVINTLLAKQPDGMVVEPVDVKASVPPLQNVNDQGIPMVTMDTIIGNGHYGAGGPADFPLAYVGSDNTAAGKTSCETLAKLLNGKGQVFIQADVPTDSSIIARINGCKQAFAKSPGIKIVDTQYGNEDAGLSQQQAETVMQKYPNLAGIFSAATAPSEGTATALKNSNKEKQIQFVAFDASQVEVNDLKRGLIDALIAQQPRLMGDLGVKMVVAALEGQKNLPTFVDTGTQVVTPQNISKFNLSKLEY